MISADSPWPEPMESQTPHVRPTLRCLKDMGADVPTLDLPLHALPDSPVKEAQAIPAAWEAGGVKRIRSLKDRVWFKVKTSRWRAAATRLSDGDTTFNSLIDGEHRWWLGAAGHREDGSKNDFYAALEVECAAVKSSAKPLGIDTDPLLPTEWDCKRVRAESALIARDVYDPRHLAVMLDSFPLIENSDWAAEPGSIANLQPRTGEIIWSALLDPAVADAYLDRVPASEG